MADFEINRRLKHLIQDVFKTTPYDFSKKYADNGGVKTSAIMRERNGVSNNMLEAICSAYPEINRTWLLTGEGKMLNDSQNNNSGNIVNDAGRDNFFNQTQEQGVSNLLEEKDKRIEGLEREVASLKADKEKLWELVMNRTNPDNR